MTKRYKNIICRNGIGNGKPDFGLKAVAPLMFGNLNVFFKRIYLRTAV